MPTPALERVDAGLLAIDPFGRTSVGGLYAADLITPAPAVAQALGTGQRAAVGVTD